MLLSSGSGICEQNATNWNGRLFRELSLAKKLFKFWIRKSVCDSVDDFTANHAAYPLLTDSDSEFTDDDNCAGVNNSTDTETNGNEEVTEDSAVFHGKTKKRRNLGETLTTFLPVIQLSNFMFGFLNFMNRSSGSVWMVLAFQSTRSS